jgi:hypothetical protein
VGYAFGGYAFGGQAQASFFVMGSSLGFWIGGLVGRWGGKLVVRVTDKIGSKWNGR